MQKQQISWLRFGQKWEKVIPNRQFFGAKLTDSQRWNLYWSDRNYRRKRIISRHFDGSIQMVMVSKYQLPFPLVMVNKNLTPFPHLEMTGKYLNSFPGLGLSDFWKKRWKWQVGIQRHYQINNRWKSMCFPMVPSKDDLNSQTFQLVYNGT